MNSQARTMLHLAAEPRNDHSTTPDLAAGRCGLLRNLAAGAALSPSTTWAPPSNRHAITLANGCAFASLLLIRYTPKSRKRGKIRSPPTGLLLPRCCCPTRCGHPSISNPSGTSP